MASHAVQALGVQPFGSPYFAMKITTLTLIASLSLGVSPAIAAAAAPAADASRTFPGPSMSGKPANVGSGANAPNAANAAAISSASVAPRETFTLQQLLSLSQTTNKGVEAAQAGVDAATAAITSAGAYPNPQVEVMYGRLRGREAGVASGSAPTMSITQKLDYPSQRKLRQAMAERGLDASEATRLAFQADLSARVKTGYYGVLRRASELSAAREDLSMMRQIHSRARLRVEVGEAPRYELIKAETELLTAQKTLQSAELRVEQSKAALRQQVGGGMPALYAVDGSLGKAPQLPGFAQLRGRLHDGNAELVQRRMELERASIGVDYQKSLRMPEVALRASTERQPDNAVSQVGLVVTIPLWDRRSGPVGEATAQAIQARTNYEAREFELDQELESAYRQLEITQAQASALETGIVREAESALAVAESAYRFGERGILDFIDAQRVLRGARNELITAQYEQQMAAIQIEKLLSATPTTPIAMPATSPVPSAPTTGIQ